MRIYIYIYILELLHIIERDDGEPLLDCSGMPNKEIFVSPIYHLTSASTLYDEKLTESSAGDNDDNIPSISIPNQGCICVIGLSPMKKMMFCVNHGKRCSCTNGVWAYTNRYMYRCKYHFHKGCIFE